MQLSARVAVVFLGAFVAPVAGAHARATTGSPLEKVVELLTDIKDKIVMDGKKESQLYDKYACWCELTSARKANAIEQAQKDLRSLGQLILKYKGTVAIRTAEILKLKQDIKKSESEQESLLALREKQNAAFMEETTEMKQAIAALEKAILVIIEGAAQPAKEEAELLQAGSKATAATTMRVVKEVIDVLPSTFALKTSQLALLSEFAGARSASAYAPQSATVQGILKDMYDTMTADLESATDTEASQNRKHEGLMHDHIEQVKEWEAIKATKEEEKAEAESLLADTTQTYDDTENQKKADIEFFKDAKEACEKKHDEWELRQELRAEELKGVVEAIELLTSDSARELFASAIKPGKETLLQVGAPSFLQLHGGDEAGAPVMHAYSALKTQATQAHSLRLAALAVQVHETKKGHFDAVIQSIDDMIQTLKDEEAADIDKRDECIEQYRQINKTIENVQWLIRKNDAKIDKLTRLIALRNEQLTETKDKITETKKYMEDLQKERVAENQEFLDAKKEDKDTIVLLTQTREVLEAYYKNRSIEMGEIQGSVKGAALVQDPEFAISADQAPEFEFSKMDSHAGESKGVVSLMTMLIEDLNDEIRNGMKDETAAQIEYVKQIKAATKLLKELGEKKINLEDMISKRGEDKTAEKEDKEDNEKDHETEVTYREKITPDCDFILAQFTKRADHRAMEMEGLVGAKEYLVGAKKPAAAFLEEQKGNRAFDDSALSKIHFLGIRQ